MTHFISFTFFGIFAGSDLLIIKVNEPKTFSHCLNKEKQSFLVIFILIFANFYYSNVFSSFCYCFSILMDLHIYFIEFEFIVKVMTVEK